MQCCLTDKCGTSASRSLESPSQSWEAVHRSEVPTLGPLDDSDLEWDLEPPDWQAALGREALRQLKPKEKKRQDVLNELFHTERSHVRTLKVLERIFRRPLQQQELLAPELLQRLFPNLDELLRIHQGFSTLMKRRRAQEPLIGDIGPMMLAMLDGESGERLQQAVATFCQHQSLALEALKARQKKDQKLAQFLAVSPLMHFASVQVLRLSMRVLPSPLVLGEGRAPSRSPTATGVLCYGALALRCQILCACESRTIVGHNDVSPGQQRPAVVPHLPCLLMEWRPVELPPTLRSRPALLGLLVLLADLAALHRMGDVLVQARTPGIGLGHHPFLFYARMTCVQQLWGNLGHMLCGITTPEPQRRKPCCKLNSVALCL
ncbi:hypothetical protein HPB50_020641 [Hyalomma asiaticum]|uniref:Uncharacterized protein n=1 Tax=Hyalomma asiaticum TaxID=266040 RepID=A0ACB7SAA3_HYAAI|nr:hypothetical protein HPB50_020641 [Hyalomma asiaticum]